MAHHYSLVIRKAFWKLPDVTHFPSSSYGPMHACGSAKRAINNIYRSLGVPARESVYVTSTINTLSTIHGHRYIGGSSTTHSRLTPSPRNPREYPKCTLYFQKLESFIYIFPLTVCVYFHSFFSGGRRNFPQDFSISKRKAFRPFKVIQGR